MRSLEAHVACLLFIPGQLVSVLAFQLFLSEKRVCFRPAMHVKERSGLLVRTAIFTSVGTGGTELYNKG